MLAWDIIVLNGYLLLNLAIVLYILFKRYRGKEVNSRGYFFFMLFYCLAYGVTALMEPLQFLFEFGAFDAQSLQLVLQN